MKNLVLSALLLGGLSQATGCIITSSSDDYGHVHATWNLIGEGCPPGGGTAEVVSQNVTTQQEWVDLFNCTDGEGATARLPLGTYDVWVNILDTSDALWAQSFTQRVTIDLDGEHVPAVFDIQTDAAFMFATWTLTEEQTNAVLTCEEVGADGVSILSTLVGSGGMSYDDIFDCADGEGVTDPLPLGDYTVITYLLDAQDEVLGASMDRQVSLEWGNQLFDLGNFEFTFEPL